MILYLTFQSSVSILCIGVIKYLTDIKIPVTQTTYKHTDKTQTNRQIRQTNKYTTNTQKQTDNTQTNRQIYKKHTKRDNPQT